MDAHLPDVNFNQALPRKLVMLNGRIFAECQLNQCSAPKTRDIKWAHISLMSTLINALPRKLVILNGRTFP